MVHTLASAVTPVAGVLRLLRTNMFALDMRDQVVTVPQVTSVAPFPLTCRDLISAHSPFVMRRAARCGSVAVLANYAGEVHVRIFKLVSDLAALRWMQPIFI